MYKPIFTEKQKKKFRRKEKLKDFAMYAAAVGIVLMASIEWGV